MPSAEILASLALLLIAVYIVYRQIASGRAERARRETDQFAAEILDNTGEGIVVYDREFRYLLWNRFMEDMTGLAAEDVLGKPATEIFPHMREQGVDELVRRAMEGQTVASPDIHYYVPGTDRSGWVSAVYRPHYDATGNIVGAIGLIRDITQRKSTEEQMQYQAYDDALTGLANRRGEFPHRKRLPESAGLLFRNPDSLRRPSGPARVLSRISRRPAGAASCSLRSTPSATTRLRGEGGRRPDEGVSFEAPKSARNLDGG